jgi:hypothetical protein
LRRPKPCHGVPGHAWRVKRGVVELVEATSGRFSEIRTEAASTTGLKQAATPSNKLHTFGNSLTDSVGGFHLVKKFSSSPSGCFARRTRSARRNCRPAGVGKRRPYIRVISLPARNRLAKAGGKSLRWPPARHAGDFDACGNGDLEGSWPAASWRNQMGIDVRGLLSQRAPPPFCLAAPKLRPRAFPSESLPRCRA